MLRFPFILRWPGINSSGLRLSSLTRWITRPPWNLRFKLPQNRWSASASIYVNTLEISAVGYPGFDASICITSSNVKFWMDLLASDGEVLLGNVGKVCFEKLSEWADLPSAV